MPRAHVTMLTAGVMQEIIDFLEDNAKRRLGEDDRKKISRNIRAIATTYLNALTKPPLSSDKKNTKRTTKPTSAQLLQTWSAINGHCNGILKELGGKGVEGLYNIQDDLFDDILKVEAGTSADTLDTAIKYIRKFANITRKRMLEFEHNPSTVAIGDAAFDEFLKGMAFIWHGATGEKPKAYIDKATSKAAGKLTTFLGLTLAPFRSKFHGRIPSETAIAKRWERMSAKIIFPSN